jgi:hypothetical protein
MHGGWASTLTVTLPKGVREKKVPRSDSSEIIINDQPVLAGWW